MLAGPVWFLQHTSTLVFLFVIATFLILFLNTAGGQLIVAEYLEQYHKMLEAYTEFYGIE